MRPAGTAVRDRGGGRGVAIVCGPGERWENDMGGRADTRDGARSRTGGPMRFSSFTIGGCDGKRFELTDAAEALGLCGGKWRIYASGGAEVRERSAGVQGAAEKWSASRQRKGGAGRRVNGLDESNRARRTEQPYVPHRTAKLHTLIQYGVRHHEKPRVSKTRKRSTVWGSIPIARLHFRFA